jgi:hypothetical protein
MSIEFAILYGIAAGLVTLYRCRAWFFPPTE